MDLVLAGQGLRLFAKGVVALAKIGACAERGWTSFAHSASSLTGQEIFLEAFPNEAVRGVSAQATQRS